MKKLFLLGFFASAVSALYAQTKITRNALIGKWNITAIDVRGSYYYNVEKDSAAISDAMKAKAKTAQEVGVMNAALKAQAAGFAKGYFQFNADGTAEILMLSGDKANTPYTVHEDHSTITLEGKTPVRGPINASVNGDKAEFRMMVQNSNVVMWLKKDK